MTPAELDAIEASNLLELELSTIHALINEVRRLQAELHKKESTAKANQDYNLTMREME